jgi:hypothetical protein
MENKVKLSIIFSARDDGYGDNRPAPGSNIISPFTFIQRLKMCTEANIKNFLKHLSEDELEIIIVDWSPLDEKYLYQNEEVKEVLSHKCITNIIVPGEAVESMGCSKNAFYEFFAKNVGIRRAKGEYILITNGDIMFDEVSCKETCDVIKDEENKSKSHYWRCHSRKDVDHDLNLIMEGLNFGRIGNDVFEDYYLGTPASGDYLLVTKEDLINKGKGYDEGNSEHNKPGEMYTPTSTFRHYGAFQDGESIFNLYLNGVTPEKVNGSVLHIDHAKAPDNGGVWNKNGYENTENWGLLESESKKINNNTIILI